VGFRTLCVSNLAQILAQLEGAEEDQIMLDEAEEEALTS
jgi:hypothetical protein